MGLCKVLSKTELEGERGGCCDRLLQNSGYNISVIGKKPSGSS